MRKYMRTERGRCVPKPETNSRRIIARLEGEGWVNVGGGKHNKFRHAERPRITFMVPRHRELSEGVARAIAKFAGWQ
jgi:predicted RNA binding protein YcfA (HicA-like mRNA interferase family)